MEEIFQDYKHYTNWIDENYHNRKGADFDRIIEKELLIERKVNITGVTHRFLTKEEFELRNEKSFIKIPKLKK